MPALISVKNLEKTYFGKGVETRAVRGVSFDIEEGEFVAIMGPSGSGKSTVLHMIGFLDEPTGGKYIYKGKDSDEYSGPQRARIRNQEMGFVFQTFNLLGKTSVYENVRLPLFYSPIPEKKWQSMVHKAIESVGLTHRIEHSPAQLSGGEKQRVAIARALVLEPDIVFADEPTGNLDSKSGQSVMEILQDLNEEGKTVILITHETYTANHAKRLIKVVDGEIEKDEKVKERKIAREGFHK